MLREMHRAIFLVLAPRALRAELTETVALVRESVRVIREEFNHDYRGVVIDDEALFREVQDYVASISPELADRVEYFDPHDEDLPLFERFHVHEQLHKALDRKVWLPSGGSLIIEHTEALVVIDVNTGRNVGSSSLEETVYRNNLEAAEEICRQLRLRNMGGLIVLDFIDMKSRRDQQAVYQRVKEGLKRDKSKTHILPISQLGLMEMTRQRHTESVRAAVYDDCPYCKGRGKVKSSLTMSVEIQRKLAEILKRRQRDESDFQLRIVVNPTVLKRLRSEDEKLLIELEKRYFGKLSFRPDPTFHPEQFKIVNVATEEEMASVGG